MVLLSEGGGEILDDGSGDEDCEDKYESKEIPFFDVKLAEVVREGDGEVSAGKTHI